MSYHIRECDSGSVGSLPLDTIGQRGVMADERPLVHVFLIQESMPLDALIAVRVTKTEQNVR